MYNCEECKKDFEIDWRRDKRLRKYEPIPRFCSRSCANTRPQSEISNEKRRLKLAGRKPSGGNNGGHKWNDADRKKAINNRLANNLSRLLVAPWENLSEFCRRKRVLAEQKDICAECSNPQTWNGKPLKFHYDHIDGKKATEYDNRRENVRMICPNCHSQTPTYTAKNMSPKGREICRLVGMKNFWNAKKV